MTATQTPQKITPPQLAREWGIDSDKVLAWIRSGELRAVNAATRPGGVPRYLIDRDDVRAFEAARAVTAPAPSRPRRKRASGAVVEFV